MREVIAAAVIAVLAVGMMILGLRRWTAYSPNDPHDNGGNG